MYKFRDLVVELQMLPVCCQFCRSGNYRCQVVVVGGGG